MVQGRSGEAQQFAPQITLRSEDLEIDGERIRLFAPDECWDGDHVAKKYVERLVEQLRAAARHLNPRTP